MAKTNFNNLTTEELTLWGRQIWKMARNMSFIHSFSSTGTNALVQRVTELKKSSKGARAVMTLVPDLTGDGVTGDYVLEGNEEEIKAYDQVIKIDQLRNANRSEGRLAEQKSVVAFREQSRDVLAYWLADRCDQLAFLTMSGIAYTINMDGSTRPVLAAGQNLGDLEFAADVTAATSNRHFRWDNGTSTYVAGNTALVAAGDKISYKALVRAKAKAKNQYIRGIKDGGNKEVFHVFITPDAMADLVLDADFIANVRGAGVRGSKNTLFAGSDSVMVDGMMIHQFRHVFNTLGLAGGSKWGAAGTIDGYRALFCGAQALGMADIGNPYWDEDSFDYKNSPGIAVGKMFGFKKPVFNSIYTGQAEDFGLMTLDFASE